MIEKLGKKTLFLLILFFLLFGVQMAWSSSSCGRYEYDCRFHYIDKESSGWPLPYISNDNINADASGFNTLSEEQNYRRGEYRFNEFIEGRANYFNFAVDVLFYSLLLPALILGFIKIILLVQKYTKKS